MPSLLSLPPHRSSEPPARPWHPGRGSTAVLALWLAACASGPQGSDAPPPDPVVVKAQIVTLLPSTTADRPGWANDVFTAFSALELRPTPEHLCAALAVTEQESGYRANPSVPNLPKIAWSEIEQRADRLGVPALAVRLALKLDSPNGQSYSERLDRVSTEKDLSDIFEDLIGTVPLGKRLFGSLNPVRTAGPMQVSIAYAEQFADGHGYPYPVASTLRNEVFTRRGGLYFGIAHLLSYPANYDQMLYRFADFNAGHHASRNAAFQNAVSRASGITLDLDGDLIRPGSDRDSPPGSTELATRALSKHLGMSHSEIRRALEQGDTPDFDATTLYRKVFALADGMERRMLPRAVVPRIALQSPKITRKLTTEWFANRVDDRFRKCLARAK